MMELNLNRVDYLQIAVTQPNCMKALPLAKKENTHRVAVADTSGVVQVFGVKKKDVQSVFKTLCGSSITRLELGGPSGHQQDRIFVASGAIVRGYTRRGKQFLDFNSNKTEAIRSFCVSGSDLMLCGNYIYNQYHDCHDVAYCLCADELNDVLVLPTENRTLTPVLACKDRMIRILQESSVLYECQVTGPPQTLCLYGGNGGDSGEEVLYGTSDGQIGLIQLSSLAGEHVWTLPNERRSGGVLCMSNYDITGDGVRDLLVGRDDGQVEVYGYSDAGEPVLRFSQTCGESVTAVQGGCVGSAEFAEVLCCTYAGWLMGFTTESQRQTPVPVAARGESTAVSAGSNNAKILQLKKELEELTERLNVERNRYQVTSQNESAVSALPYFSINDKFALNQEDATYTLSLEVQSPIDYVLLQSDVPFDLIDVEKNSAVISYSSCDPEDGNFMLATYRCQANTKRLELKINTIEGQYGIVRAYVTPHAKPKTCQVRNYQIKPLSLHLRTSRFDDNRPLNKLRLLGSFSTAEMHSWVASCLPEVPDRTPTGDVITFTFVSTFLGTALECTYKRGEAQFRSDNISVINILKDALTKEATKKSIRLEVTYDLDDRSIPHILRLIHPKLEHQLQLAKKMKLLDALTDLEMHENGLDCLSAENKEILQNAEQLRTAYKRHPCHLERLQGIIVDLYIDSFKFRGRNVKGKIQQLMSVLDTYTFEGLLDFFSSSAA